MNENNIINGSDVEIATEDKAVNESNEITENAGEIKLPSMKDAIPVEIAKEICRLLESKKAERIKLLHIEEKTTIADYFVLCSGNSSTHVKALAGEVEFCMDKREITPEHVEGRGNNSWILLDYGSVIIHIFSYEARDFYNLDKLYGDAEAISYKL